MPPKKDRKPTRQPWQVILEQIKSDNRTTIETVQGIESRLEAKIDAGFAEVKVEVQDLRQAVKQNSTDIKELKGAVQQNTTDIRVLSGKVDALGGLEERVSALERKGA